MTKTSRDGASSSAYETVRTGNNHLRTELPLDSSMFENREHKREESDVEENKVTSVQNAAEFQCSNLCILYTCIAACVL